MTIHSIILMLFFESDGHSARPVLLGNSREKHVEVVDIWILSIDLGQEYKLNPSPTCGMSFEAVVDN